MKYILYNSEYMAGANLILCVDSISNESAQDEKDGFGYIVSIQVKPNVANIRNIKIRLSGADCDRRLKRLMKKKLVEIPKLESQGIEVKTYKEFCVLLEEKDYDTLSLYYMQMGNIENYSEEKNKTTKGIKDFTELTSSWSDDYNALDDGETDGGKCLEDMLQELVDAEEDMKQIDKLPIKKSKKTKQEKRK